MPLSSARKKEILALMVQHVPILLEENAKELQRNAEYCKLCILDAFAGRLSSGLASNKKKGKFIFTIFQIQTSELLLNLILLCSIVHSLCIFVEPTPGSQASIGVRVLHTSSILLYIIDILLKIGYQGVEDYFDSEWQFLYAASAGLNLVDLLVHGGRTSWCNCLRPVAGLLRSREGRRFFEAVQKMMPIVIESLVPLTLFIIVVSIICLLVFGEHFTEGSSSLEHHYNWFWLILTNDTMGKLLPEHMFSNTIYQFFFFAMIYIGQKFLLSLILGATFDTFKSMTEKQLKKEKVKELQGLVKAFSAIDIQKSGVISLETWGALMKEMDFSPEEAALYYELISGGSPDLTVYQFLSLKNVLDYKFHFNSAFSVSQDHLARWVAGLLPASCDALLPPAICQCATPVLGGLDLERCRLGLACLDLLLLASCAHNASVFPFVTVKYLTMYALGALLCLPSMYPVLLNYAKSAKSFPLTAEGLEFLLEEKFSLHVLYVAVVIKMVYDVLFGFHGGDLIAVSYLGASTVVSALNIADGLLQLVQRQGNLRELILNEVHASDYVQMATFLCVFADILAPAFGLSGLLHAMLNARVILLIRTVSCLRVFNYNDVKFLVKKLRDVLSSVVVTIPPELGVWMDKASGILKAALEPKKVEKKEKKEKKDKDKKDKKKKELVLVDIPSRLRIGLVTVDAILLVSDFYDVPLIPFFPLSILTPCRIVSMFYAFDTLVCLREQKGKLIDIIPSEMTISTVYVVGAVYVFLASLLQMTALTLLPYVGILVSPELLLVGRLVRCLRLIGLNKELETFLKAISGVTNLFVQQMMFAFVTVYMFAMLGNLLFSRTENFADPLKATVTCQRLFLPADFIDITEDTMEKTSAVAIIYFVVFFFVSLVVCNIALSIVIEWYADCLNDDGKTAAEKENKAQVKLIEGITTRAQSRNLLRNLGFVKSGMKRKLHFDGLTFSRAQRNDTRSKLVGPLSLTPKDLADCQKYASIDLVKGFKDYVQAQESKDEAGFIDTFVSAEVGTMHSFESGDVIFAASQEANKGFIFISGNILVKCLNGQWYPLSPLCFLGFEVLTPNGVYALTCKADGPVECLVVEQDDIIKEMDDELSGSLIRLSFKTRDAIHMAVEADMKNRAKRRRSLGIDSKSSEDTQIEAPMARTAVLISDDNEKYQELASQVLINLGCATKQVNFDKNLLDRHLRTNKYAATLSDLHSAPTNDSKVVSVSGHLTMCMPAHHALEQSILIEAHSIVKIVLVVDDSSVCRKQISRIVNSIGFEDELAENGQIAVEKLTADPKKYCAVVMDLLMPVMNGFDALRVIREDLKLKLPVFVSSGQSDNADVREQVIKLAATAIFNKPAEISEFTAAFLKAGLISPLSP